MKNKILSLILAIFILVELSGCSKETEKEETQAGPGTETFDDTELFIDDLYQERMISDSLTGSSIDISEFLDEINALEVNYNYEEYYNSINYDELIAAANDIQDCNNIGKYEWPDVYNKILENSGLTTEQEAQTQGEYEVVLALENALYDLYNDNDYVGDDFCKLKDVKVLVDKIEYENTLGTYDKVEELITIDYEKILSTYNELEDSSNITFIDYLSNIMRHELNHARQFICDCREEKGQKNRAIENTEETLSITIEASAESEIYNEEINKIKSTNFDTYDFTYITERETQSLLFLMGMFKENFSIDEYYQAIFNSDFQKLYDLFDLKEKEDFITFYKIIYARNSIELRTQLSDDLFNQGCKYPEDLYDLIGNDYKVDIFKIVIKDLIKKVNEENISLGESLMLYNFVKCVIVSYEYKWEQINDESVAVYPQEFYQGVKCVDDIFYAFTCKYYNITSLELFEIENNCIENDMYGLINYFTYEKNEKYTDFIQKYPVMSEIIFCCLISDYNIELFNQADDNLSLTLSY